MGGEQDCSQAGTCSTIPKVSLVDEHAVAADADMAANPQRNVLLLAGVADEDVILPASAALHSGRLRRLWALWLVFPWPLSPNQPACRKAAAHGCDRSCRTPKPHAF